MYITVVGTPRFMNLVGVLKQCTSIPVIFCGLFILRGKDLIFKLGCFAYNYSILGLGRVSNGEYRKFVMCLIKSYDTKGSFKYYDVRMCMKYLISVCYSKFCRQYNQVLIDMILRCLIIRSASNTLMPPSSNYLAIHVL